MTSMHSNSNSTTHSQLQLGSIHPQSADIASFNDDTMNTLITDMDEYNFGSPKEITNVHTVNTHNRAREFWPHGAHRDEHPIAAAQTVGGINGKVESEPIDHLILLANQLLSTLREIIMTRYRRGASLKEIYRHFDRDQKRHFNAKVR